MLQKFQGHIATELPFLRDKKTLVAISGGVDSVVLAHLCKAENLDFALAHCNFQLRESESDTDEAFVRDLAKKMGVEVFVKCFDTLDYAKKHKLSTQLAARDLRYQWFDELCQDKKYTFVLTAHHLNDSQETFFINLLRGTGLDGLSGIPQQNGQVVRPLLNFTRKEILAYAQKEDIGWREDRTNATDDYLRNRIRHHLVPWFENENPNFSGNFSTTQEHLQDITNLVDDYTSVLKEKIVEQDGGHYHLKINKLKEIPHTKAVLFQLLHSFGFTAWDDIHALLDAQPGKQVFSNTHRLLKDRKVLILTRRTHKVQESYRIFAITKKVSFPKGKLILEKVAAVTEKDNRIAYIPADKINFPLKLRLWRPGDVFRPFGMQGRKKISDFLKDEKVSLLEKENTWVLTSNGLIVWVVGHRIDNAFRAEKNLKNLIKIELHT